MGHLAQLLSSQKSSTYLVSNDDISKNVITFSSLAHYWLSCGRYLYSNHPPNHLQVVPWYYTMAGKEVKLHCFYGKQYYRGSNFFSSISE